MIKAISRLWDGLGGIAAKSTYFDSVSPMIGDYSGLGGGESWGNAFYDVTAKPWVNSAFYACASWIGNAFPEAPIVLQRRDKTATDTEGWVDLPDHPLTLMLSRPNGSYGGRKLWSSTQLSLCARGNGYWIKHRNALGIVEGLWYYPHGYIKPVWDTVRGGPWIVAYEVSTSGFGALAGVPDLRKMYHPLDVVHFRNGLDPDNPRYGLNPMNAAGTEIRADHEAARATYYLMKQLGVAVPMFSPKGDVEVDDVAANLFKIQYMQNSTNEGRGMPMVASLPLEYHQVGATPKDMMFGENRMETAARICAVMGLDPMVVSLPSNSKTYSNFGEAREAAIENRIIPGYRDTEDELNVQLLSDFVVDPENYRIRFLEAKMRALQTDMSVVRKDAAALYQAGAIDRAATKRMIGEEVDEADKGVYRVDPLATSPDPAVNDSLQTIKAIDKLWVARVRGSNIGDS